MAAMETLLRTQLRHSQSQLSEMSDSSLVVFVGPCVEVVSSTPPSESLAVSLSLWWRSVVLVALFFLVGSGCVLGW